MIYVGPILYGGVATGEMYSWDTTSSDGYARIDLGRTFGGGFRAYYSWPFGLQTGLTLRYDMMLVRWGGASSSSKYYRHIDVSSVFFEPFASLETALGRVMLEAAIGVPVVYSRAKYEYYDYYSYPSPHEEKKTYQFSAPLVLGLNPSISVKLPFGRVSPYISLSYPMVSAKNYKGKDKEGNDIFLDRDFDVLLECSEDCKKFDLSGPRLGLGVDVRVR